MWFTLYFVNIVTNLFTSEKPEIPCTKDIFVNLSLIRRQKPNPIAIHFNSTEHSVNDYEIVALENICGDDCYRERQSKNFG